MKCCCEILLRRQSKWSHFEKSLANKSFLVRVMRESISLHNRERLLNICPRGLVRPSSGLNNWLKKKKPPLISFQDAGKVFATRKMIIKNDLREDRLNV